MATKFITVSVEIMHDKNLNHTQKFILAEIEQLVSLEYGCIAQNSHFAELIGVSRECVSRNISDLQTMGYITVEIINGTRNHTRIISLDESSNPPRRNVKPPLTNNQETKDNKTTNITVNTIVEYLNQRTNKRFNSQSKDSQLIKQLLNKDYKMEDFKLVIDHKVSEWLNDDEMSKFLRPSTLFGSKFDRYLNEAIPTQSKPTRRLG